MRLALVPIFVLLLINPGTLMIFAAIAVFTLAAITDLFDGLIARRFNCISDVGKLLDPLADKLLVMAALVMLLGQRDIYNGEPWVPAWMVFLVLAREIWVTGLRGVAATHGLVVAAGNAGKVKSALQMIAIWLLLLHDIPLNRFGLHWTCQELGLYLMLISIAFSIWSAIDYTVAIFKLKNLLGKQDGEE